MSFDRCDGANHTACQQEKVADEAEILNEEEDLSGEE